MEYNILIGKSWGKEEESVKEFLFGREEKNYKVFPDNTRFPQLIRDLGIWKSAEEAKRNGWDKDIPGGFTDILSIGKKRDRITILKIIK